MSENKTKPNDVPVIDFLRTVENPARQRDAQQICEFMAAVTGEQPVMWGGAIVGFGVHHYQYASGRRGVTCRVGFSPRKSANVVYLTCDLDRYDDLLARLGHHDRGVGCLHIKRLDNINYAVFEELIRTAWADRT